MLLIHAFVASSLLLFRVASAAPLQVPVGLSNCNVEGPLNIEGNALDEHIAIFCEAFKDIPFEGNAFVQNLTVSGTNVLFGAVASEDNDELEITEEQCKDAFYMLQSDCVSPAGTTQGGFIGVNGVTFSLEPSPEDTPAEPLLQKRTSSDGPVLGDPMPDRDAKVAIDAHNICRIRHNPNNRKLVWDKDLAWQAKQLANKCAHYHQITDFAQNLFIGISDINRAVEGWYSEKKYYTGPNSDFMKTGHFQNIVWKETRRIGCAINRGCAGGAVFFCNYWPHYGSAAQNV